VIFEKIPHMKKTLIIILSIILVFFIVKQLALRWLFEASNNYVEVCVDYKQLLAISLKNNYKIDYLLDRVKTIGVTSAVLEEETVDSLNERGKIIYFSKPEIEKYKLLGLVPSEAPLMPETAVFKSNDLAKYFKLIIKEKLDKDPEEIKTGNYRIFKITPAIKDVGCGYLKEDIGLINKYGLNLIFKPYKDFWVPFSLPVNFSAVMISEKFDPSLVPALKDANIKLVLLEFSKEEQKFSKILIPNALNVVRGHKIPLSGLKVPVLVNRWVRAAKERNCRVLYFDFIDDLKLEDNLDYLRSVCAGLKKSGFLLDKAKYNRGLYFLPRWIDKLAGLLIAVFAPLFAVYFILKKHLLKENNSIAGAVKTFWLVCAISLLAGLLIAALLSRVEFINKLDSFRGIKISIALPLILSVFCFYKIEDIRKFLYKPLNLGNLALLAIIASAFLFLLLRSGNMREISGFESNLRLQLESMMGVRPRFKEFLIGHPALIIGLAFNSPMLIIIGLLGQISIINTFMHAHTPVYLSLLRVFYGLVIGFVAGLVPVYILKRFK